VNATVTLGLVLAFAAGTALAAEPPAAQSAKWVSRKVDFAFQGFTSTYSCDGLREDVATLLTALGARKQDLKLRSSPCAAPGISELSKFPEVHGTISVLVPATAEEAGQADPAIVPAHWQSIDLTHVRGFDNRHDGQCELLEQTKRYLLPLFTSRNLDFTSDCVPHQEMLNGVTFKVEVLQPDPKPAS